MLSKSNRSEPLCALSTTKRDFSGGWERLRDHSLIWSCLSPCSVRWSRLPGISRWAEKKKSLNLQPYLGRGPSVSSEVDILQLLRNATLCAPRFASQSKFTHSHRQFGFQTLLDPKATRKAGRTFRPSCSSVAQLELRLFSSSSNLTDVTGCVLPNPEVCVSGNGAQQPSGGQNAGAAPPPVGCRQETREVGPPERGHLALSP